MTGQKNNGEFLLFSWDPQMSQWNIEVKGEQNSLFPVRPVSVLLYLPIKNREKLFK